MTTGEIGVSKAFYAHFAEKLLNDYVHGNPRIEAAIDHTLRWLPANANQILDIGCGIGWSSWECKRHLPDASVFAVDLSPSLIDVARQLFDAPGLTFSTRDIIGQEEPPDSTFDAIVMLDVYEHIPQAARPVLHQKLSRLLSKNGLFILTCPSVAYQTELRAKGEGLQPVDEDVTEADVAQLAQDIGAQLLSFNYVTVWNPDDYFHAVIQRADARTSRWTGNHKQPAIEPQPIRAQRVINRLGVRIMRGGLFVSHRGDKTLCIVTPKQDTYSETFIRAHIGRLPAKIMALYGGHVAALHDEHGPLVPPFTLRRHLKESVARKFRKLEWEDFQRAYIRQYLQNNQVDAILTEYGPMGVMMMDVCQEAGIPLIVHFHGVDAYSAETLAEAGQHYPQLFKTAQAFIAVSRDMERQLLALGAPRDKLFYNPCGVDVNGFQRAQPSQSSPLFLAVGRFVDKKSPLLLIMAFAKTVAVVPEARLQMIGDGYLLEGSKQLAVALGLEGKIDFMGAGAPAQVAAAMQNARAFVQHSVRTSYGDSEGTPVSVMEACASGLPVIATRHAGIADMIVDGETGLLVDEGDVEGMVNQMICVARDPALADKLGYAARNYIRNSHYAMPQNTERLWQIICQAIEGGQNPS